MPKSCSLLHHSCFLLYFLLLFLFSILFLYKSVRFCYRNTNKHTFAKLFWFYFCSPILQLFVVLFDFIFISIFFLCTLFVCFYLFIFASFNDWKVVQLFFFLFLLYLFVFVFFLFRFFFCVLFKATIKLKFIYENKRI